MQNRISLLMAAAAQGIVEYILILVVTVAVVLGIFFQFNDAFRLFANNYFGNYIACLLETGELPSMGSQGNAQGTCGAFLQPFDLNSGKASNALANGGGGGSAGQNANSSSSSQGRATNDNANVAGNASYSRIPPTNNGANASNGNNNRMSFGSGANGAEGGKASLYTGSDESSIPTAALHGSRGPTSNLRNRSFSDDDYGYGRKTVLDQESSRFSIHSSETSDVKNNNRLRVQRKPASKDQNQQDGSPWTFGNFIRILIIAAIIIILVLLIGSQALQISKGMES